MAEWNIDELEIDYAKYDKKELLKVLIEYFNSEDFIKDKERLSEQSKNKSKNGTM